MKIDIISASAGSGKTHKLTELLKEEVGESRARPGAVVATTFTNRAAAELQERVRTGLLKAGRIDDAQILATARIGTVNSVCGGLVSSFAFVLGMPVRLQVLDEVQAGVVLKRTLSQVVTPAEVDELAGLSVRWRDLDWQEDVATLVDLARSNGIGADQLAACAERSRKDYQALLGKTRKDGAKMSRNLEKAIDDLTRAADALDYPPSVTKQAVARARGFLGQLRSERVPPWSEWLWLSKLEAGAKVKAEAERVRAAALDHDGHPQMRADAEQIIELVFSIAARILKAYQDYKLDLGLIDFVDQEVLALDLLRRKDVQNRLRDEIDLILVDEFQDTSPLQLAVFLALSRLCDRSVWVGDQKQAIYGFRGTDPRLMDAVIEAILKDGKPETLDRSYRSRPELVRLTSDVFQDVFKPQGILKERVRLEPDKDDEPEGLGPIVERWILQTKNKPNDADAIASGIKQLLEDPQTRVRSTDGRETREVRPCDVAVLCRINEECGLVAGALERVGVRAAIPRVGLLNTPEARLVHAGLRLRFDPEDRLALAELLRLARHADSPDKWLEEIIKTADDPKKLKFDLVDGIHKARAESPLAGPLQVFDAVVEAVHARELCLAWGGSRDRLYNLDALREHVVRYLFGVSEGGAAGTLGGLLAWLDRLATDETDEQATVADETAVVVSTWHGAKGLEWPLVVIHSLSSGPKSSALGMTVVSPNKKFDFNDPLACRWIRYWPYPYSGLRANSELKNRLEKHDATKAAKEEEARERLRLLYVCWTRARDRLLLPARPGKLTSGVLNLLESGGKQMITEAESAGEEAEVTWAGRKVKLAVRNLSPEEAKEHVVEPGEGYEPAGPQDYPRAFQNPSDMTGEGSTKEPETIGDRHKPKGSPDTKHLGEAIHGFFGADRDGLKEPERLAIAEGLLERWEVKESLSPGDLIKAGDALKAWVKNRWPDAKWHREMPMTYKHDSGSTVHGICDLALQTKDGWVVIDHKSYQSAEKAAQPAAQLKAYADGITKATGKPILGCFVHLPMAGLVVPVKSELP